jgi:hypothetical protein
MHVSYYDHFLTIVAPFGWCVHLFTPNNKGETFLARCSKTKLFYGIDIKKYNWRLIALRINHIEHNKVLKMVEDYEHITKRSTRHEP